jgi:glycosyltransferase involved in cell wall biosynthesis
MVIVHLITGLRLGGAEDQLKCLVLNSDRNRFRHIVISIEPEGPIAAELKEGGIEVYSLGVRKIPSPMHLARLTLLLRRFHEPTLHCWLYHGCFMGSVTARFGRVRHMIWGLRSANQDLHGYPRLTRGVIRLCSLLSPLASVIVVNSNNSKELHQHWGYCARTMRVIPNGVDTRRFAPKAEERRSVREELGIPQDAIAVGMFARFSPMKDHETFFKAAGRVSQKYPRLRYVLAGADIDEKNPALERMIIENRLQGVVSLLGQRRDMPRITAGLDIACLSSRSESFPNALLEAMSTGLTCVATNVGDVAAIVGNTGKVVAPLNPPAFAEALMALVAMDPNERKAMGQRARARVLELFALEGTVRAYEEVYDALSNKDVRPATGTDPLKEMHA